MKKSELTHIIQEIVAEEIRKQLPQVLTEVFSNFMQGRAVMTEARVPRPSAPQEVENETPSLKESLREMFANTPRATPAPAAPAKKTFTKNPVLNDILNQTSPFSGLARQQMGGISSAAAMAAAMAGVGASSGTPDMGEVIDETPSFLQNVPTMPGVNPGVQIPVGRPPVLQEGQTSTHAPLGDLGQISALDLKQHAPPAVSAALSRNYASMMKLIDKKAKRLP